MYNKVFESKGNIACFLYKKRFSLRITVLYISLQQNLKIKVRVLSVVMAVIIVIIVSTSFFESLPLPHPASNPIYIGLIVSGIIVGTTWWAHTTIQKLQK